MENVYCLYNGQLHYFEAPNIIDHGYIKDKIKFSNDKEHYLLITRDFFEGINLYIFTEGTLSKLRKKMISQNYCGNPIYFLDIMIIDDDITDREFTEIPPYIKTIYICHWNFDLKNLTLNNLPDNIETIIYFGNIEKLSNNYPIGLKNIIGSKYKKKNIKKIPWGCTMTFL